MKNKIKWYEKIFISLFSLFLIISTIWITVMLVTSAKAFFIFEFQKNDTVNVTGYSMEELSKITDVIIAFLFNKSDSMQVTINNQIVFSNQAIKHMSDVRDLYNGGQIIGLVIFLLTIAIAIYFFFNWQRVKKHIFKYSVIVYVLLGAILLGLLVFAIVDFEKAFYWFHKAIFPDPAKFNDAFFDTISNYPEAPGVDNQMLVKILSNQLFMDVGIIIASFATTALLAWTIFSLTMMIKSKRPHLNNI